MKKNVIVAQLARTGSRWQHAFLRALGFKAFHEPTGGWAPGKFEVALSWNHYLTTRLSCNPNNFKDNFDNCEKKEKYNNAMAEKLYGNDLRDVIESREYIEVGYASLPFLENVPCDWRLLGTVRHPQTWIHSAYSYKFYHNHISWKPSTLEDYAKIWVHFNSLILKHAERVFRMEDFYPTPEIFSQQFGYFKELTNEQKTIENSTTGSSFRSTPIHRAQQQNEIRTNDNCSWWHIVEELAEKFGYKKLSLDEFDEIETRYNRKNPSARVYKKLPVEIMEEK
jgi:hypothetical protein